MSSPNTICGGRAIKLQKRFNTKDDDRLAQVHWMATEGQEPGGKVKNQSLIFLGQGREGRKSKDLEGDSPLKRVAVEMDHRFDQSSGVYSSSIGQSKNVSGICYSPRLRHHKDELCLSYPRSHQTRNSMNFESPNGKMKNKKHGKSPQNEALTRKARQSIQIKTTTREAQEEGKDTYRGYGEETGEGRTRPYFLQLPREDQSERDRAQGSPSVRSQGNNDLSAIRDVNTSNGSAQTSNKPLLFKVSIPQSSTTAARQLP